MENRLVIVRNGIKIDRIDHPEFYDDNTLNMNERSGPPRLLFTQWCRMLNNRDAVQKHYNQYPLTFKQSYPMKPTGKIDRNGKMICLGDTVLWWTGWAAHSKKENGVNTASMRDIRQFENGFYSIGGTYNSWKGPEVEVMSDKDIEMAAANGWSDRTWIYREDDGSLQELTALLHMGEEGLRQFSEMWERKFDKEGDVGAAIWADYLYSKAKEKYERHS